MMKETFLTITSTAPTVRYLNHGETEVYYTFNHDPEAIDMSVVKDGCLVLDDHYGRAVGIIREVQITPNWTGGVCLWLPDAGAIAEDAAKLYRRNASAELITIKKRRVGEHLGKPLFSIDRWRLEAVALVCYPGNPTVGIERRYCPAAGCRHGGVQSPTSVAGCQF